MRITANAIISALLISFGYTRVIPQRYTSLAMRTLSWDDTHVRFLRSTDVRTQNTSDPISQNARPFGRTPTEPKLRLLTDDESPGGETDSEVPIESDAALAAAQRAAQLRSAQLPAHHASAQLPAHRAS